MDDQGTGHDWRNELVAQLLKVQADDGSWVNDNGRWMPQPARKRSVNDVAGVFQR